MSRLIYLDRRDYLPQRVVERGPEDEIFTVTDCVDVERLPVNDATVAQLRMSPHPGATRQELEPVSPPEASPLTVGKPGP